MSPLSNTFQDDTDAKSGLDLGLSATTGVHAQHHNDLATTVNALMGRWTTLVFGHVHLTAATAATYVAQLAITEELVATTSFAVHGFRFDPANYAITGWTMKMRVIADFLQSATANAGTSVMTAGLYPLTMGGTTTWVPTLGTVTTGSTAAQTGGSASSENTVVSSTFTAPAADTYALAVVVATATTAGATRIPVRLEYSYA
jgi:hypothetical protein